MRYIILKRHRLIHLYMKLQTFRSWKEEKDNELYDKKREEKRKEEKKKMKELETKDEKRRGSRSAYKSW